MPPRTTPTRLAGWLARSLALACLAIGTTALDACAPFMSDANALTDTEQLNDPLEPVNREVYAFNTEVRHALTPVAEQAGVLAPIWLGVHNVLVNLREPLVFSNDLLQGRDCAAGASLRRFMVNSTIGVVGIFDVGKQLGVEAHDNDFGQTLAVWGLPAGPFLMLPALGPSDLRGTTGMTVEYFVDPVDVAFGRAGRLAPNWPPTVADLADRQIEAASDLDKLERTSLDGYAALRSAYRQNLDEAIGDDKCPAVLRVPRDSGGQYAAEQ